MDKSRGVDRREFLRGTVGGGLALGLGGQLWGLPAAAQGANDRIAIAMIGVGGMGTNHLKRLLNTDRVQVVALCDVDSERLQKAADLAKGAATSHSDYPEILASDDVDAVAISTPDHWHAKITIEACDAGKDVYVEKPQSLTIAEGRQMVDAARRNGRVVQLGTQQRSQSHFRRAVEIVRNGHLGEVKSTRCWIKARKLDGFADDGEPPAALNYDRWLGPAPWRPYNPKRVHYSWRYFWDYGGGLMSDWGVHLMDIVHWAMGQEHPLSVEGTGTAAVDSPMEVPFELDVRYTYPGFTLNWTQDRDPKRDPENHGYGIWFEGSEAQMFVDRNGFKLYPETVQEPPQADEAWKLPRVKSHWDEFLDCMATREKPTCDVAVGHATTTAAILGNLVYRIGRKLTWDAASERFVNDPAADELLSRPERAGYEVG